MVNEMIRADILEAIASVTGHSSDEGRVTTLLRFCPNGHRLPDRSAMAFMCQEPACGYQGVRAVTFRPESWFRIRSGQLVHRSVGAIVTCRFNEESTERVALIRRATHPVGAYSIPSGHHDLGEEAWNSAAREVSEETGLRSEHLIDPTLVSEAGDGDGEPLSEQCRRGADQHLWHCFRCRVAPTNARLTLEVDPARGVVGEADGIGWFHVDELSRVSLTKPAAHFLGRALELENIYGRLR
jgi:ADP-ribose pyrophosphatase YjhB (NUDIX family)